MRGESEPSLQHGERSAFKIEEPVVWERRKRLRDNGLSLSEIAKTEHVLLGTEGIVSRQAIWTSLRSHAREGDTPGKGALTNQFYRDARRIVRNQNRLAGKNLQPRELVKQP